MTALAAALENSNIMDPSFLSSFSALADLREVDIDVYDDDEVDDGEREKKVMMDSRESEGDAAKVG